MDPNATLEEIISLAAELADIDPTEMPAPMAVFDYLEKAQELANHINNLDTWLTLGGFKPARWQERDLDNDS